MNHTSMTGEQTLTLLRCLAIDDSFRDLFSSDMPAALASLGLPACVVSEARKRSLVCGDLASKSEFHQAWLELSKQAATARLSMIVPSLRLNYHERQAA
ncbi:MAG: NHLP-related RiPP peptide [Mizugakiibacter sp.]|uniref:NHLP-related RiPP peptide n=1 Tax=Mizugakiibacter sp. TaxID=1972610 RepID=UPI0031C21747|nr:NHLP-related RiPP peptide [Xanthomonadaceae bacterium]